MKPFLLVIIFLFSLLFSCSEKVISWPPDFRRTINREIEAIVQSQAYGRYNGNILVTKGRDVIVRQSYGYTDFSEKQQIRHKSRFNVGSLAKEIVAVDLLDLVLEGKILFSNIIAQYLDFLPGWGSETLLTICYFMRVAFRIWISILRLRIA